MKATSVDTLKNVAQDRLCCRMVVDSNGRFQICRPWSCMAWRERKRDLYRSVKGKWQTVSYYEGWCGLAGPCADEDDYTAADGDQEETCQKN